MDFQIADSFELLTDGEWDEYLGTHMFDNLRVSSANFEIIENGEFQFIRPKLVELLKEENNKVGSLNISYALCRHYYDKGIPDTPWFKAGEKIEYMPLFKEEHWMRSYWFNFFSDVFYMKISSIWDSIIEILNHYYNLEYANDLRLRNNVLKWLKHNATTVYSVIMEMNNSDLYKTAQEYRTQAAHGLSASTIKNSVIVKKGEPIIIKTTDKDGNTLIREAKSTVYSVGIGEYTDVKTVMTNMEEYAIFSGVRIQKIVELITKQTSSESVPRS